MIHKKLVATVWWSFVALLAVATVLAVVGCAHIPANTIPRPMPGRDVEVVDYVAHFNSSSEWEHAQWYRIGDPYEMTGFFVVSQIGSICLRQDGTWVGARHGEFFACPGGWRGRSNSVGTTGTRIAPS